MSVHGGPKINKTGLVGLWDASNEKSYSGSTFNDISGNNNHGTIVGSPTFVSGSNGNFDITTQHISLGTSMVFTTALSVCMWIYPANTWPSFAIFADKSPVGVNGANAQFRFQRNGSTSGIEYYDGFNAVTGGSMTVDSWNFVAFAAGSGSVSLYINGANVALGTALSTFDVAGNGANTLLGAYSPGAGPSNLFKGKISSCMIYNTKLTDDNVLQIFNATKGKFGL